MSCMHQSDFSLVDKSNINSDALLINQCNQNDFKYYQITKGNDDVFNARMIYTTERGLSKSRNMALKNAIGDICLIADDDEKFVESFKDKIESAYQINRKADVIAFALIREQKSYPQKAYRVGFISALRISSPQISFRRESIQKKGIQFDETMGSGTGNGGGEENKFLYDCIRRGLKVYYQPIIIAEVGQSPSQWFHGYTEKYFLDKGWAFKKIKGHFLGLLSAIRFAIVKYDLYKHEIRMSKALRFVIKGVFEKR